MKLLLHTILIFPRIFHVNWLTRSLIHLSIHLQITCRSVCDRNLDQSKLSLITWLFPSEALDHLILWRVKGQERCQASLVSEKMSWYYNVLVPQSSTSSLDQLLKRMLIAWFHFDPSPKCFNRWCVCDQPLLHPRIKNIKSVRRCSDSRSATSIETR